MIKEWKAYANDAKNVKCKMYKLRFAYSIVNVIVYYKFYLESNLRHFMITLVSLLNALKSLYKSLHK